MQLIIKAAISGCIIALCLVIGKKWPSLGGLIAVMPLTGVFVMVWLYVGQSTDNQKMVRYCQGALWGIIPSVLFFITAYCCFRKTLPLWLVLIISFSVWIVAAFVHQYIFHTYLGSK